MEKKRERGYEVHYTCKNGDFKEVVQGVMLPDKIICPMCYKPVKGSVMKTIYFPVQPSLDDLKNIMNNAVFYANELKDKTLAPIALGLIFKQLLEQHIEENRIITIPDVGS